MASSKGVGPHRQWHQSFERYRYFRFAAVVGAVEVLDFCPTDALVAISDDF